MSSAEHHLAALASLPDAGPARLRWLVELGDPMETWERLRLGALRAEGARSRRDAALRIDAQLLQRWREHAAGPWPQRMEQLLGRLDVRVSHGSSLPVRLGADVDPPPVLFERGQGLVGTEALVAVVGTRRASPYGLRLAERLGRELSEAGVSVVSGLALGVDAAAHAGALQGSTPPVAVVGAGHDRPCPVRNRGLARAVAERGTIYSEVPPGVASAPWRFPARNRCIAALAHVLVVVESPPAGGSMLTVAEAVHRDRIVMAVPGSVERSTSAGCHLLLRDGAHVCTGALDVCCMLSLLGVLDRAAPSIPASSGPEDRVERGSMTELAASVLDLVEQAPRTTDGVLAATGVGLGELGAALSELEARGLLVRRGGWIEAGGSGS